MNSHAVKWSDDEPSRWSRIRWAVGDWQPCYRFMRKHLTMNDSDTYRAESGNIIAMPWMEALMAWEKSHPVRHRLWRIYCVSSHPVQLFKDKVTRPLRRFWQRGRSGWCREDVWSVDGYLSRIIPEMLDELRKNNHSWPGPPMTDEEWNGDGGLLDQMAQAFRANAKACNMEYMEENERYDREKHAPIEAALMKQSKKGLKLFVKYYNELWD